MLALRKTTRNPANIYLRAFLMINFLDGVVCSSSFYRIPRGYKISELLCWASSCCSLPGSCVFAQASADTTVCASASVCGMMQHVLSTMSFVLNVTTFCPPQLCCSLLSQRSPAPQALLSLHSRPLQYSVETCPVVRGMASPQATSTWISGGRRTL